MSRQDEKRNLCAIVVSYEPDVPVLLSLIDQISSQTDFLVIDNASHNVQDFLPIATAKSSCLGVRALPQNIGLATAMNLGLRQVKDAGYAFAVLFDQDSQVPASFFDDMQMAYTQARQLCRAPVAAIGPRIVSIRDESLMPFKTFSRFFKRSDIRISGSEHLYKADFLISSGCLFVMKHLKVIGEMKDEYFIDNIDLEWCFRAKKKGYEIVGTDHARLNHSIGEKSDSLLVRKGLIVSHSPLRSYYSTRNRFALYREAHAPIAWKLRDFPRFIFKTMWLLLFSKNRVAYAKNIWRGLKDSRGIV